MSLDLHLSLLHAFKRQVQGLNRGLKHKARKLVKKVSAWNNLCAKKTSEQARTVPVMQWGERNFHNKAARTLCEYS